jgi:hypothetical protein
MQLDLFKNNIYLNIVIEKRQASKCGIFTCLYRTEPCDIIISEHMECKSLTMLSCQENDSTIRIQKKPICRD